MGAKLGLIFLAFLLNVVLITGAKMGGICLYNINCQNDTPGPLSECLYLIPPGICRCQTGSVSNSSNPLVATCVKAAERVGDPCEVEAQCTYFYSNNLGLGHLAQCENHVCTCVPGAKASDNGRRCIPEKLVGEECEMDTQCPNSNFGGACTEGICTCPEGRIGNGAGDYCISIHDLGEYCSETIQCQAGNGGELSVCADDDPYDTCQCSEGSEANEDNKCVPIEN